MLQKVCILIADQQLEVRFFLIPISLYSSKVEQNTVNIWVRCSSHLKGAFLCKKKRDLSLMVKHATFNRYNVGSSPTDLI